MPAQTTPEAEILFRSGATVTGAAQRWVQRQIGNPYPRISSYFANRPAVAPYPVMASPPTVTRIGTSITHGGVTYSSGNTKHQPTISNARMVCSGSEYTATTLGGRNILDAAHITLTTGALSRTTCPYRVRFMSDAAAINLCFRELVGTSFSVIIDGQMVSRENLTPFSNSGDYSYFRVSFGTDSTTYRKASSIGLTAGGTGYAQGDLVTFNGGTGSAAGSPLIVKIGAVTGGVVTAGTNLTIMDGGAYTTLPTGTFSQASTTGAGTGLQIAASFFHPMHAVRKMRRWEIIISGVGAFFGIVPEGDDVVLPWPEPTDQPKVVFVGDSNSAGTYLDYAGAHLPTILAQSLGVHDRYIVSAQGGTGWNVDSGTSPRWSHANRIADFLRHDADIYVFAGSQNDSAGSTLTGVVTTALNSILAGNPRALIVGLSNILSSTAGPDASIAAGFAGASDQSRVRYISSQLPIPWLDPLYYSKYYVTSDPSHLSRQGSEFWATTAATQVRDAVLSMT